MIVLSLSFTSFDTMMHEATQDLSPEQIAPVRKEEQGVSAVIEAAMLKGAETGEIPTRDPILIAYPSSPSCASGRRTTRRAGPASRAGENGKGAHRGALRGARPAAVVECGRAIGLNRRRVSEPSGAMAPARKATCSEAFHRRLLYVVTRHMLET